MPKYNTWPKIAKLRQILFAMLILIPTLTATSFLPQTLPNKGQSLIEIAIVLVFAILFAGINLGFWLSFFGFLTLLNPKKDNWAISKQLYKENGQEEEIDIKGQQTAILIPICQEDINRVMAGIKACYQSLEKTGHLENYEFFILSDSQNSDLWIDEEMAWYNLVEQLKAEGRLHYRRRKVNLKRKSGNIADFCRRWGSNFEFMIVYDADSIMSGDAMVKLTKLMVKRTEVGLIQTVPKGVMKTSPLARIQQFTSHAYGPIFSAGLNWLLLGGSMFWGHNAIIRIAPFMQYCGLPRLSGIAPLGGDIMSHDFVESSLLKRAGWDVWLAYDIENTYEEVPTTMLEELKRDQRWCQGNLQHLKLMVAKNFSFTQRLMFLNGAYSYLSSFFWFLALILATLEVSLIALRQHNYFTSSSLFPQWPTWTSKWTFLILAITAFFLFAPKFMSLAIIYKNKKADSFGGKLKLFLSFLSETIYSIFTAPVKMLFISKVIIFTILGKSAGWKSQNRNDHMVPIKDSFLFHGFGMVLAVIWGFIIIKSNPTFFWWMSPILISLFIAPIITIVSSIPALGQKLMQWGLWRIPEESNVPVELKEVEINLKSLEEAKNPLSGFIRAAIDPKSNSIHLSLIDRNKKVEPTINLRRKMLVERLIALGPQGLDNKQKIEILSDAKSFNSLHHKLWSLSDEQKLKEWQFHKI